MTSFLQLLALLAVIILAAKTAGYLSTRVGQPSVFGELLVGVLLGPSLLNITHLPFITNTHLAETIQEFGEIGVLLLMFLAGLELHLSELAKNTAVSAYGGVLGVLMPVSLGALTGSLFGMDLEHSLFLGLTLGATSVSISAQTLIELGRLRSRVGLGLLGAAVFDDILVILLLSTFTALLSGSDAGFAQILMIIVRMVIFLVGGALIGLYLFPRMYRRVSRLPISQGLVALTLIVLFVYGITSELIGGMAAITGAFLAGLMVGRTTEKDRIENGLSAIAYGLFVPIFFVNIGLQINVREMPASAIWLILAISAVGILGKIIGSGIGAKLGKFSWVESLQLGIGMVSRGEVGLIVASVGLTNGLLSEEVFSAIVAMVLITTLVTPPLLRASFSDRLTHRNAKPTVSQEAE